MKSGFDIQSSDPAAVLDKSDLACDLASDNSIGAHFEKIVTRFPEKTAIKTEQESVTYRQLNARANRIAHTILASHNSSPSRIALLFDQGPDALAALLGVLKAGHAFVPLDSADPATRIQTVLKDCKPAALITDERHAALAAQLCGDTTSILNLSCLPTDVPESNPDVSVSPDSCSYLFYTSGSTGQPKGVCQLHRNLLHYIACYSGTLGITDGDRLSLLYSLSFSASNMDVFSALLRGATLCPYDIRKRGTAGLADWLDKEAVTILHAVPTVFRHLLQNVNPERRFTSIRAVDLGGEAVFPGDIEPHRNHFGKSCLLVNHLAATEISVIAQHQVNQSATYNCDMLPVGRPAPETAIRIVREDGTEADVSEPGEIVIHSPFLSPGYWQRPDLNAGTFAEDQERPGWRIYYSGDLGYFGDDGELFFLGRKDFRVKIRGHSVDMSEVEVALQETSWIRNVAVSIRENDNNARHLVAFLEAGQTQREQLPDLRRSLQTRLPAYMIPSEFIFLESLPLTTSGKIDRKALAQLKSDAGETAESRPDADNLDELEQSVINCFQKIFQQRSVRRSDDFFLLGGDSLKATELHLHLQDSLGLLIPLEQLFQNSTVAGITDFLRQQSSNIESARSSSVLVALRESGHKPKLFLTHGGKGQAFVSPHFLKIIGEDQPVYAYQATGLHRSSMSRNTIEEMAAEYVCAMRKIQPYGPYFLGSLCVGSVVTLEMAHQLTEAGEVVGPLLLIDPPVTPPGQYHWSRRFPSFLRNFVRGSFPGIAVDLTSKTAIREDAIWSRPAMLLHAKLKKFMLRLGSDKKLMRNLRQRKEQGRITLNVENHQSMREASRVVYDFTLALLKYRLKPYHGPVLMLRSTERRSEESGTGLQKLKHSLAGDVQVWDVEGRHNQLHDVNNAEFARQLRHCMEAAWKTFESLPHRTSAR